MAHRTTPTSPDISQFQDFCGDQSDIRRDITLLSYLLAKVNVDCDKNCIGDGASGYYNLGKQRRSSNVNLLEAWTHLACMLTTGDAQVAVTGQFERDAITAALVISRRSAPESQASQFSVSELQTTNTGLGLLQKYDSIAMDVTFSEHAADVFAILKHLFS
ncbi:hypothetical protein C8T65DRAFT_738206 [Cerioporus squamosus]|nr:hypothetical protein C8T65DRAFT_738206 [Cerioporus squamosus]